MISVRSLFPSVRGIPAAAFRQSFQKMRLKFPHFEGANIQFSPMKGRSVRWLGMGIIGGAIYQGMEAPIAHAATNEKLPLAISSPERDALVRRISQLDDEFAKVHMERLGQWFLWDKYVVIGVISAVLKYFSFYNPFVLTWFVGNVVAAMLYRGRGHDSEMRRKHSEGNVIISILDSLSKQGRLDLVPQLMDKLKTSYLAGGEGLDALVNKVVDLERFDLLLPIHLGYKHFDSFMSMDSVVTKMIRRGFTSHGIEEVLTQVGHCGFLIGTLHVVWGNQKLLNELWKICKESSCFRRSVLEMAARRGESQWIDKLDHIWGIHRSEEATRLAIKNGHSDFAEKLEDLQKISDERWEKDLKEDLRNIRNQTCALIVQAIADYNGALTQSRRPCQKNIDQMKRSGITPVLREIKTVNEIGFLMDQLIKQNNTVSCLWIRGHGCSLGIKIGDGHEFVSEDIATAFAVADVQGYGFIREGSLVESFVHKLANHATIILDSCSTGKDSADRPCIARVLSEYRPDITVVAPKEDTISTVLLSPDPKQTAFYALESDKKSCAVVFGPKNASESDVNSQAAS